MNDNRRRRKPVCRQAGKGGKNAKRFKKTKKL